MAYFFMRHRQQSIFQISVSAQIRLFRQKSVDLHRKCIFYSSAPIESVRIGFPVADNTRMPSFSSAGRLEHKNLLLLFFCQAFNGV